MESKPPPEHVYTPKPIRTPSSQPIQVPRQSIQAPPQNIQGPFKPIQVPPQSIQVPPQPIQGPTKPIQVPPQSIQVPPQPIQGPTKPIQIPPQPVSAVKPPLYTLGPQVVVPADGSFLKQDYDAVTSQSLGIIQITGGVLVILCLAIVPSVGSTSMFSGSGFWYGVMFIVIGCFGLTAGKHPTKCRIVTYMVLAIISALFTLGIFCGLRAGFDEDRKLNLQVYSIWQLNYMTDDYHPEPLFNTNTYEWVSFWQSAQVYNSLLIIVAVVELVTLMWGTFMACEATCQYQEQEVDVEKLPVPKPPPYRRDVHKTPEVCKHVPNSLLSEYRKT